MTHIVRMWKISERINPGYYQTILQDQRPRDGCWILEGRLKDLVIRDDLYDGLVGSSILTEFRRRKGLLCVISIQGACWCNYCTHQWFEIESSAQLARRKQTARPESAIDCDLMRKSDQPGITRLRR